MKNPLSPSETVKWLLEKQEILEEENAKLRKALTRCVTELGYVIEAPDGLRRTAETEAAWREGAEALKS